MIWFHPLLTSSLPNNDDDNDQSDDDDDSNASNRSSDKGCLSLLLPQVLLLMAPSVDVCDVFPVVVPGAVLSPDFAETQGCFIVFLSKNKYLKQEWLLAF